MDYLKRPIWMSLFYQKGMIAEIFKEVCLDDKGKSVKDMLVWLSLITYGSGEAMGSATKLFTLEGKLSYHPKLCELKEKKIFSILHQVNC